MYQISHWKEVEQWSITETVKRSQIKVILGKFNLIGFTFFNIYWKSFIHYLTSTTSLSNFLHDWIYVSWRFLWNFIVWQVNFIRFFLHLNEPFKGFLDILQDNLSQTCHKFDNLGFQSLFFTPKINLIFLKIIFVL